jgi:integrase
LRALNRLTARGIASLDVGKHADGGGLWLHKRPDGGAQWFLRITIFGMRREMGLGPYPAVSLSEARQKATDARAQVRQGIDPINDRERKKREAVRNLHRFKEVALDAFESRKAQLKGDGLAGRWFSALELHVLPKLGNVPVAQIDQIYIRDTLRPIWHAKAETAQKALSRINIVLKHAAALGFQVDLQAPEKARALLGKPRHKTENIPALPWQEVPAFYASLNEVSSTHLALRFLILTGMRSTPVRHLHEDQISGDVWTIPAETMKGKRDATEDFRVPLCRETLAIIETARRGARGGYLFPSPLKGVISDATMARHMERQNMEARPHGFRTSLRVWLAEQTDAPHEVAETMLAHG